MVIGDGRKSTRSGRTWGSFSAGTGSTGIAYANGLGGRTGALSASPPRPNKNAYKERNATSLRRNRTLSYSLILFVSFSTSLKLLRYPRLQSDK